MWRDRRADVVVAAAAALALAVFTVREHLIAGGFGLPLDDAWIHLHFARNIAGGDGFAYNPGEPVAGSTAPLWTVLLAAGVTAGGASIWVAKTIGVACTVAAGLITRRLVLALGGGDTAALTAGVGFVLAGPVVWGALSGMEVSLAALLVGASLVAHARDRTWVAATLATAAVLARPEAAILVPLLLVARPLTLPRMTAFVVVAAALLAPAVWFAFVTSGTLVPAPAAAKIEGGLLGWLAGQRESLGTALVVRPVRFLGEWIEWLWTVNYLLPFVILAALVWTVWRRGREWRWPASALILHPLAMALLAPYRGPGFQEGRYSIHLLPLALALGWGMVRDGGRALPVLYLATAMLLLAPASERYGWAVQNINAMQVHLGEWVASHTERTARLAMNDIGAIAFVSRRRVIDLMGLVTPAIRPYRREGESGVLRYLDETCPDYVIIFPAWFPQVAAMDERYRPLHRVRLQRNEVAGADEMVVYQVVRCAV